MSFACTSPSQFTASKLTYSSPVSSINSVYTTRSPVYSSLITSSPLSYHTQPATVHKLSSLRNENTELVSQSQRLLNELESTSTQLSVAKRKIHTLEHKLKTDPSTNDDHSPPTTILGNTLSYSPGNTLSYSPGNTLSYSPSNVPSSKDDGWTIKHKTLSDQLADVQEECQRLKDACINVEQKTNRRKTNPQQRQQQQQQQLYDRPVSSQSWRGIPSSSSSYYPSFSRYYDPPTVGIGRSHSDYATRPVTTTNSVSSYKPLDSGLDRSLSGSNTSLSSIKSAREPLTSAFNHSLIKSSVFSNGQNNLVELEKSKSKIRKLDKQVSILEKQLKDKAKLSESHVEELTKMRTLLAQEKATNAINSHQSQEKAASEIGRIRALNMEQNSELQAQLTKLKGVKNKLESELDKSRVALKGCQDDNRLLSERVSKLLSQLEGERSSQRSSLDHLRHEAESGQTRVTELEKELMTYQIQLKNCLKDIESEKERKDNENMRIDRQIVAFSTQLQNCQNQLSDAFNTIQQLNTQLEEKESEIKELKEIEEEKRTDILSQMKDNRNSKETLMRQLESANTEIMILTQRTGSLQESSLHARQLEGEVLQLRKSLSDQQNLRMGLQHAKEEFEQEMERCRNENKTMKGRLEQSSLQLSDMQRRSEEWRIDRERITKKSKELQTELEKKQRDIIGLKNHLRQHEQDKMAKENTITTSLQHLQQELTKRTEQVMEMDTLLRTQRAESVSKNHEYEMKLAKSDESLRTKTKEINTLLMTIDEFEKKINDHSTNKTKLAHKNDLINIMELQIKSKDGEIKALTDRLSASRREVAGLNEALSKAKTREDESGTLVSRDQQIMRLKEQVQQLLQQERMKQEEVSRCRAQVVSLSTELSVERQMVQETRQQLAQERASRRHATQQVLPLSPTTPTSLYNPPMTSKTSQILTSKSQNSENPPAVNHTNRNNIIHI